MAKRLFLFDGHAHCYQAFFGIRHLTAPDGRPVNAVYGFVGALRKVLREYAPDYLAAAFDAKGPTFRHEMYEAYKATRKPPPGEFIAQLPIVQEVLAAYRIPVYTLAGFEADDLLGTLAMQGVKQGLDVYLLTSDKDAKQLLGPQVRLLDTRSGKETTVESLREEEGIAPEQVIDLMSLSGDSSDNVPGVRGVGPKTAMDLIGKWGTLDNVLAHIPEIEPAGVRKKVGEHVQEARLSHELVTIDTDAPVTLDLAACAVKPPDVTRLRPVFEALGFKQFLSDLEAPVVRATGAYTLIDNEQAFAGLIAQLKRQPCFAFDTETTGTDPMRVELVGMSFSWQGGQGFYVPVRGPAGDPVLNRDTLLAAVKPILGDAKVGKVGQNLKYDALVMRRHAAPLEGIVGDTMVAGYVLDPTRGRYSLDAMAFDFLHHYGIPIAQLIGEGKQQITMDMVPVAKVAEYASEDADLAWRLTECLESRLKAEGFDELYRTIEVPLIPVLEEMEFHGIRLDVSVLQEMSKELQAEIDTLLKKIYTEVGTEFNVDSPKQLAGILFGRLGLPVKRRTRTGPSTDAEVLGELSLEHRVPALVVEYRQLKKLKSTYVDALPAMVHPETGRIHASFNQTVTATGRLSSSNPNLQNIPVRTERGGRIREAFIPGEAGWLLLAADYSQIELRLLAHLSQDEALVAAFRHDEDIHAFVAAQINGCALEDVTSAMRRVAKAVNFGIVYGQTPYGLSRSLGIAVPDAETFIRSYFERYPRVKRFIDDTVAEARRRKCVETLWGRRRPIPNLDSRNVAQRNFAERAAVNTIVQGSAADLIKIAMIRLHERVRREKLAGHMLLQIHDELIFETPPDELERLRAIAVAEMTGAATLRVPIVVNTSAGRNWAEAK